MTELGRLERINDIKAIWPTEPQNFTPWLASEDNLALLSETLGYAPEWLELVGMEMDVGNFRADIVCRETDPEGRVVLIENQFGPTDHDHLGKLLTYAAGHDAKVLIWVTERIREEHEAALDFLNNISSDDFQVFGIEVELWKIGDSAPAPRFNVVAKPNNWVRQTKGKSKEPGKERQLTETQQTQLAYWTAFRTTLERYSPPFRPVSAQPASWISHGIGKTGVALNISQSTRGNWVRVEIYLSGKIAKGYFTLLEAKKTDIEETLGYNLDWQRLEDGLDSRICIVRDQSDPMNREDWPAQHEWLAQRAIEIYSAFHPLVRNLGREVGEVFS